MTMPSRNGQPVPQRKQFQSQDSLCERARRMDDLQSALLEVGKAAGFPLSYLAQPQRWYNASRDPVEYEPLRPYGTEQEMIRDLVATAARIGTAEQRDAIRCATRRYFEKRADDALEMIGTESEADLTALTLESEREISEARCATITALTDGTPEALDVAERENREAEVLIDQLSDSLRLTARRKREGTSVLPFRGMR